MLKIALYSQVCKYTPVKVFCIGYWLFVVFQKCHKLQAVIHLLQAPIHKLPAVIHKLQAVIHKYQSVIKRLRPWGVVAEWS